MKKLLIFLLCFSSLCAENIFLTAVFRDQAHLLNRFLKTVENIDYDKKHIGIHFYTYNNSDETAALLNAWAKQHKEAYKDVAVEVFQFTKLPLLLNYQKKEYSRLENKLLGEIKNNGLLQAQGYDYYLHLDPYALIAPGTLKALIAKDKPIIAPLLKSIPECDDHTSNFFSNVTEQGYWAHDENYIKILFGWQTGTFSVPLVRDVLLIKGQILPALSFTDESSDYDFVVFARSARKKGIEQYIANEQDFGVKIHFSNALSREEENRRLRNLLLMP